ncbi:MAG: hypothetical protein IPK80_18790 [Nannocystis sp.]|nr:hypothetical protein [Nannocystis sp.]
MRSSLAAAPAADPRLALAALLLAALLVALIVLYRDALARVLFCKIDPRPLALFRVLFGLSLLVYLLEIAPLADYLFSDEGLLTTPAAQLVYGAQALAGHGDGVREPYGFIDLPGLVHYLISGRWSLLFFYDSPAQVRLYLGALALTVGAMTLGWRTRLTTVLSWFLLTGLLRRGDAHWGGEQILCGLHFILLFADSGRAYSLDNWRRIRRLRAVDAPSAGSSRAALARYPAIPAWPQGLLVAQLALSYFVNGWTKTGATWQSGDTLRLALHLDRYARLDWHPLALELGPWPFRLATWGVLWWERLFPLLLLGLWLRASAVAEVPPLRGRARHAATTTWLLLAVALATWALTPGALAAAPGAIADERALALGLLAAAIALLAALSARRPPTPPPHLKALTRALLAPRLWLGFGLVFHLTTLFFFSIGAFALSTLAAYVLCRASSFTLPERHVLKDTSEGHDPTVDDADPYVRRVAPSPVLAAAGALIVLGAALALRAGEPHPDWWWNGAWFAAAALLLIAAWRAGPAPPADLASPGATSAPLITPLARLLAGGFITYHLTALLMWQLPALARAPWRPTARALVEPWLDLSYTRQLWSMFAPNGPTYNQSLRTTVLDAHGVAHDLRTELQRPENLTRPYLRHDRRRKVDEAISGYRPWLTPWHARYLCRRWALDHRGEPPREITLERLRAPFPPARPLDPQTYFWSVAEASLLIEVHCAEEPFAQLDPELRARHGLAPAAPDELRYAWPKDQPRTWSERRARLDPLAPLWPTLGLIFGGAALALARRRRT